MSSKDLPTIEYIMFNKKNTTSCQVDNNICNIIMKILGVKRFIFDVTKIKTVFLKNLNFFNTSK